jgi:hypothetical protein
MKRSLMFLVLVFGVSAFAQDTSTITVKNSENSGGVVTITAQQAAAADQPKVSLELHCNKGVSSCKALEPGTYVMVRLPKNWGMYDCNNADIYPATADPATAQKIGEYYQAEK